MPANESLFSKNGLYGGLRFTVASLAIVLVPLAIKKTVAYCDDKLKLLAIFSAFSLCVLLFFQITTTIPDMRDPISSSRYLVPGVILSLIVLFMSPINWTQRPPLFALATTMVAITMLSSGYYTYHSHGDSNAARRELISLLCGQHLQYGYATFWNSGVLSVLSNEGVRVRQINLSNGIPVPMRWLSSNRWYRPSAWQGKTFLLLHDRELAHFDLNKMKRFGVTPIEQIPIHNYTIYIFAENIANKLPGWDTRYEEPVRFLPSIDTLSQVGHYRAL